MELKFLYPFWGSENLSPTDFFDLVVENNFDGIEINIPKNSEFEKDFYKSLNDIRRKNSDFLCGLQQVFGIRKESADDYLHKVLKRLSDMEKYQPNFINSHTGKDYFSFDENCKIIEAIEEFSVKTGIPIYHEIHRGRFTFHSQTTLNYLKRFPDLKFVGDFSHWCVVSESLLQDQEEAIKQIIPQITHLHVRVATEQASQITNPFAPEWSNHLERFTEIWKSIVDYHKDSGQQSTITPEFGPFPYMPQQPFTCEPLADQQTLNIDMRNYLKTKLK